jgi:alpha-L-fucosidase
MPDGRIEPRQAEVLRQVGDWLGRNGESIYGTRGGPWKPTEAITSTRKGNIIYVHILKQGGDTIELPDIAAKITSASLFDGANVAFAQHSGKVALTVPAGLRDICDTVVKLKLESSAMDLPALEVSSSARRQ